MGSNPYGPLGWTPDRIPDLSDHVVVITGGNGGLGFEASMLLGAAGSRIIWLCRNMEKANAAAARLGEDVPGVQVSVIEMDLADLESVRRAADEVAAATDRIDALVNNAGIMGIPQRETTAQGFEKQLGVNHIGHFVLGARLFPLTEASSGRVVSVSSGMHASGTMDFDNLMFDKRYGAWPAYGRSKLANHLFTHALNRRLDAAGAATTAFVCHPGYAATKLQSTGPGAFAGAVMRVTNALVAQTAARGAWSQVLCAVDPQAEADVYYGPTRLFGSRGPVGPCASTRLARNENVAEQLWEVTEALTGEKWPGLGSP